MRKKYLLLVFSLIFTFFLMSCETTNTDDAEADADSTDVVTLTGTVQALESGDPLSGAIIKITDGSTVKGTTTNSEGVFSVELEFESDRDLELVAFMAGYYEDTTSVFAIINTTIEVPTFRLSRDESVNIGDFSGKAASILLSAQSTEFIGVKESGSIETAELVFEVRDSSGVIIGEDNPIDVSFRFGSTPSGGEYLYPSVVRTNALGQVAVTLNTGTVAGVSQIIAESVVEGKVIRSKPVLIAIHGGFPDLYHFGVGPESPNYPAYYVWNFDKGIEVSAFVGDKYSNPVREGTTVYFKTNSGIIQGSGQTNVKGACVVNWISQPEPNDPVYGPGFVRITAESINENNERISTEAIVLMSGKPIISSSPSNFQLENGGTLTFNYVVADLNGNPMSETQKISVGIKSEFIELSGELSPELPATQSKAWTTFSFTALDTRPDTLSFENVAIEITTSGPNGKAGISISGTAR